MCPSVAVPSWPPLSAPAAPGAGPRGSHPPIMSAFQLLSRPMKVRRNQDFFFLFLFFPKDKKSPGKLSWRATLVRAGGGQRMTVVWVTASPPQGCCSDKGLLQGKREIRPLCFERLSLEVAFAEGVLGKTQAGAGDQAWEGAEEKGPWRGPAVREAVLATVGCPLLLPHPPCGPGGESPWWGPAWPA